MGRACISAVATKVPWYLVDMERFTDFHVLGWWLTEEEKRFCKKVIPKTMIRTKYWSVKPFDYFSDNGRPKFVDHTNRQLDWRTDTTLMCSVVASELLKNTSTDLISFNSTTGWANPDIPAKVAASLGLGHYIRRTQILGQGCYAAIPNLVRCAEAVMSGMSKKALMLAGELCSYTFQPHTKDKGYLISTILFGDGVAGAIIEEDGLFEIVDYETYTDYETFKEMSFELEHEGFRFVLTDAVPAILGEKILGPIERLTERNKLGIHDVYWLIHPGGMAIVKNICKTMNIKIPRETLSVNRNFGNMSSATIMFVLKNFIDNSLKSFDRNDHIGLITFGPGLTIETMLLKVCGNEQDESMDNSG